MIKIGDLVHILFLDHSQNHDGVVECSVYGRVLEITSNYVKIAGWYTHDIDPNSFDEPYVSWNILKSTVISAYLLNPQRADLL